MGISELLRLSIRDIEKGYIRILGNVEFKKDKKIIKKGGNKWSDYLNYERILRNDAEGEIYHSWMWLFNSPSSDPMFTIFFEEHGSRGKGYVMDIKSIQKGEYNVIEIKDKSRTILDYLEDGNK